MSEGRTLVPGETAGDALVLDEPLSLWGGLDPATGRIIDPRHPQAGATVTGRVLAMPFGRGSSSSSYILAEAVRAHTAPAAILLREPDPIIALGAIVARELYGVRLPVAVLDHKAYAAIEDGSRLEIVAEPAGSTAGVARIRPSS